MFKKNRIFEVVILLLALILFIIFLFKKHPDQQINNLNTINQINEQNSRINSISCDLTSEITNSYFFYCKPDKVILNTYFLKREESKIASDGKTYWFWIKKFNNKSVYYCRTIKIDDTRVIDPLKPNLIKSLICIDEIPLDSKIKLSDEIEVEFKDGTYERKIIIYNNRIQEQHWFLVGSPILSIYVLEHNEVPTLIKVLWHKENYSTKIRISNIQINPNKQQSFEMPDLNKINLED